MSNPHHPFVYHEFATTTKDHGHAVQEAEARIEVSNTLMSCTRDMDSRALHEFVERILKIEDAHFF
jgi:hypothetical protein